MSGVDREKLDSLVSDGWLRSQRHPEADLWIYNYTEQTQFENHWTPETLMCRGLIVSESGEVVARPFGKFFNYGDERNLPEIPNEPFHVTEKIDGSLGILYEIDGEARIATRGSFTSEQAIEGTAMLRDTDLHYGENSTPLFEIIYPENRIVVDYGDTRELVLLTAIDRATGTDSTLPQYSGRTVQHYGQVDVDTLHAKEGPNREGFVVTFESGLRMKIKFAEYVRLHKIVTGVNARMIWENMRDGNDLAAILDGIPDEIYNWIRDVESGLAEAFHGIESEAIYTFDNRPDTDERKALAAYFTQSKANPSVLFRMLDGKPYEDLIWKAVKPEPLTPEKPAATPSPPTGEGE